MADFEQAGATERLRRVAILREMQAKLKRSPAEALGVVAGAAPQEVRSAFMALTKQYHPAKFARLDEATVKLANEVFLQLREAYELLATAGNKRARTMQGVGPSEEPARKPEAQGAASGGGQGVRVSDRAGTAAGIGGPVRVPDRTSAVGHPTSAPAPAANTNTNTTTSGGSAAGRRPLIGGNRIATSAPAPTVSSPSAPPTRPSAPSISTSASTSMGPRPGGSGTSAASSPSSSSGSAPAAPPTRPSAPSISTSTSTSMGGRPSAVPATGSGKVVSSQQPSASGSAPGSASSSSAAGGPKIRFGAAAAGPSSAPSSQSAPPSQFAPSSGSQAAAPSNNNAELARIRGLISRQKWTEARDALQLLLLRAPTDRGSMAQLAYVRGREALELGNVSEARRELLRALAIEPAMEAARATLRELNDVTPSSNPSAPRR